MKVAVDKSFEKDLSNIKDKKLLSKALAIVVEIKEANSFTDIKAAKKLKGENNYYRIRMGNYRIGFSFLDDEIVLYRFLHRKEIYRYFP